MADFSKPDTVSIEEVEQRIASTDLVPSRAVLLEGLAQNFEKISQLGIRTFVDLQEAMSNSKKMESLARDTGIDPQYLVLLRREVESYLPRPFKMKEIDWVSKDMIGQLAEQGVVDSHGLLATVEDNEGERKLSEKTGISLETIHYLTHLANLGRVQWISPLTARMLVEAGFESARQVAAANAEELCARMESVNAGNKYFKGKIGLRDIRRLIHAAKFIE